MRVSQSLLFVVYVAIASPSFAFAKDAKEVLDQKERNEEGTREDATHVEGEKSDSNGEVESDHRESSGAESKSQPQSQTTGTSQTSLTDSTEAGQEVPHSVGVNGEVVEEPNDGTYEIVESSLNHQREEKGKEPGMTDTGKRYAAPALLLVPAGENHLGIKYYTTALLSTTDVPGTKDTDYYYKVSQRISIDYLHVFDTLTLRIRGYVFAGDLAVSPGANEAEKRYRERFPLHAVQGNFPYGSAYTDLHNIIQPFDANLRYDFDAGWVLFGIAPNSFGLGISENSDDFESEDGRLFGEIYGGDRGIKFEIGFRPLSFLENPIFRRFLLSITNELVYRDELADLTRGDVAYLVTGSMRYTDVDIYDPRNATLAGFKFVGRFQKDNDSNKLLMRTYDLFLKHSFSSEDSNWHFNLGLESEYVAGKTTRVSEMNGKDPGKASAIRAVGIAGELAMRYQPWSFGAELKTGWASGYLGKKGGAHYPYRFDNNYNVGLVLFDETLPTLTRANYELEVAPQWFKRPPREHQFYINDGGIEDAYYLNANVYYGESDGILAGFGILWALANKSLNYNYSTLTSESREETGKNLGVEFDVALQYTTPDLIEGLRFQSKIEAGVLVPGPALGGVDNPYVVRGRIALFW